ncbi:MATE family efflux transporter [Bacillus sp. FJAT-45350]|uniref:MATE family efflux transporter n=1 Tax=Bacillus sp. FJAT-45350 TaxID=2011014 RepID=UPI000BB9894E|nr:MATE family efflux transporter [Bacillus sp. FJAT-45350]
MSQKFQSERLGTEPIPKLLKSLSIPAIIGMVVMAIYNVADTIFISYAVGITAVAGVTIAFPLMMIMMAISAAMGIGGASVISRMLGAKKEKEANKVFGNVVTMIFLLSIIGFIGAFTFLEPVLRLFGATPEVLPYAVEYMFPIMLGTLFFTFAFSINNIVRSEGNARFAMITMVVPAVLNIILDPIFIFVLDMGVRGAAIATVISQATVFIVLIQYFLSGKSSLSITPADLKLKFSVVKEVTVVGLPAFVQQATGSLMMIAINAMLIRFGTDFYVGVFGIIQRIIMLSFMPMAGIMQGMMPIVGYNYGAGNIARLRETVMLSLKAVSIIAVAVFVIVMLFPHYLMRAFTTDVAVIEAGADSMRVMFAAVFLIGIQIVSGGLFQALGKAKLALILTLSRQFLFLIPLVLILPHFIGVKGVWLAFPIADALSFVLATYLLYRHRGTFFVDLGNHTETKEIDNATAQNG